MLKRHTGAGLHARALLLLAARSAFFPVSMAVLRAVCCHRAVGLPISIGAPSRQAGSGVSVDVPVVPHHGRHQRARCDCGCHLDISGPQLVALPLHAAGCESSQHLRRMTHHDGCMALQIMHFLMHLEVCGCLPVWSCMDSVHGCQHVAAADSSCI